MWGGCEYACGVCISGIENATPVATNNCRAEIEHFVRTVQLHRSSQVHFQSMKGEKEGGRERDIYREREKGWSSNPLTWRNSNEKHVVEVIDSQNIYKYLEANEIGVLNSIHNCQCVWLWDAKIGVSFVAMCDLHDAAYILCDRRRKKNYVHKHTHTQFVYAKEREKIVGFIV